MDLTSAFPRINAETLFSQIAKVLFIQTVNSCSCPYKAGLAELPTELCSGCTDATALDENVGWLPKCCMLSTEIHLNPGGGSSSLAMFGKLSSLISLFPKPC